MAAMALQNWQYIFHENILEFLRRVAEGTSTGNHEVFPHKLCLTRNAVKPHNFIQFLDFYRTVHHLFNQKF